MSRKIRPPSRQPGAWSGAFISALAAGVGVSCGQTKWEKAQAIISDLSQKLSQSTSLNHKDLEQKRGFLVHLQRTYPGITPFLKGIHLTLDSWRPGRNVEGWKMDNYEPELMDLLFGSDPGIRSKHPQPPVQVTAAPQLRMDLEALSSLFAAPHPPTRYIRATHTLVALYDFGDISGQGFGSSIALEDGTTLFQHGLWSDGADGSSSNYRELSNLVSAIEEGLHLGQLHLCSSSLKILLQKGPTIRAILPAEHCLSSFFAYESLICRAT
jgi:hypothetical protein